MTVREKVKENARLLSNVAVVVSILAPLVGFKLKELNQVSEIRSDIAVLQSVVQTQGRQSQQFQEKSEAASAKLEEKSSEVAEKLEARTRALEQRQAGVLVEIQGIGRDVDKIVAYIERQAFER